MQAKIFQPSVDWSPGKNWLTMIALNARTSTEDAITPLCNANMSCLWLAPSLVDTAKNPKSDATIPAPAIQNGRAALTAFPLARVAAAMIEPTKDSKRSAPIPATSPTLSPTLSAMTAGLRGSSSGMSISTLPTRSAPTSAALV